MTAQVKIKEGTYGKVKIKDQTFELHKPYVARSGDYGVVTVVGSKAQGLEDRNCRIKVKSNAFEYIGYEIPTLERSAKVEAAVRELLANETDEQAMDRLAKTFSLVERMTVAACAGIVRGLVVSGPPGIGKSYEVERTVRETFEVTDKLADAKSFTVVNGFTTAIALYQILWMYRRKGQVVVFDDCDSVFTDETALNLMKAALDTKPVRTLSYLAESRVLRENDIPDRFEFEGSIIFLTNVKFDSYRGKAKDHMAAIKSRCHFMDMEIDSLRDKILRIKQIVRDGMLKTYKFTKKEQQEVTDFVVNNAEHLEEVSLRTVIKVADLRKSLGDGWRDAAISSTMRRDARYLLMAKASDAAEEKKEDKTE